MVNKPATRIASVSKALAVLSAVAREPGGATPAQIAQALDMPVPTTYHLVNTLAEGAALTKGTDRRYRLGPRIHALAEAYFAQAEADPHLLEPLRALALETGETAYLSGWNGSEIEVLASEEGNQAVRVAGLQRGGHGHAHARASGKLLLALADERRRATYLDTHDLVALSEHTITDRADLERELDRIRHEGHSVDDQEFTIGVGCVAAPIVFDGQVIGAYTVSAPIDRFYDNREALTAAVRRAAEQAGDASWRPAEG
jgi:IclR family transcriptional regulator, acetate operon repressor